MNSTSVSLSVRDFNLFYTSLQDFFSCPLFASLPSTPRITNFQMLKMFMPTFCFPSSACVFSEVKNALLGLFWSLNYHSLCSHSSISPLSQPPCRPSSLSLSQFTLYTTFSSLNLTLLFPGLVCAIFNNPSTFLSLFPSLRTTTHQEPNF